MTQELREEARRREEERETVAKRREEFVRDLRLLASQTEGRRFLRWLIDQGDIFAEDYQPGDLGAYRAGVKALPLRLWRLLADTLSEDDFASVVLGRGERIGQRSLETGKNWTWSELPDASGFEQEQDVPDPHLLM